LGTYPEPANIVVVREFYVYAMSEEEGFPTYVSYVRGKKVPFLMSVPLIPFSALMDSLEITHANMHN